jgi:predicted AlkP superfamily phosphohydrolase/phosphomutase
MKKTVLIGIDGASYSMLTDFVKQGIIPNFAVLLQAGVFKKLMASIPDNSAVSWSSIMTGANPGEHGIFGFTDLIPKTYTLRFPNFFNMQHEPFWLQKPERSYVILNMPFTYPVKALNGYLISGFVSPDMNRAVYPPELLKMAKKMGYRIDVDAGKVRKSKDLFFDDLFAVHEKRVELYRRLWNDVDWDTFMIVFTGSDRLEHFCWSDYEDRIKPYYENFIKYFQKIDQEIGWIAEKLGEDDNLFMISDHGMERIKTEVHINTYLEQEGFLNLSDGSRKNYNNVTETSQAFALEPGRIYLHDKQKYPRGSVKNDDRNSLLEDLMPLLQELQYKGGKVVMEVLRKEEIYTGAQLASAPDLLLIPNTGYSLRGTVGREEIFGNDNILSGMHRGNDAFLYVKGQNVHEIVPDNPHVEDIITIMNRFEEE